MRIDNDDGSKSRMKNKYNKKGFIQRHLKNLNYKDIIFSINMKIISFIYLFKLNYIMRK